MILGDFGFFWCMNVNKYIMFYVFLNKVLNVIKVFFVMKEVLLF